MDKLKRSGKAKMQSLWINGVAQSHIDVRDRGFAYGDGLFETIKVSEYKALLLERHVARMKAGAVRLGFCDSAVDLLIQDLEQIDLPESAILKLTLSRGTGGRGYLYEPSMQPTRVVMLAALPDFESQAQNGIQLRLCATRLGLNPLLAGIKHLNRLEQVLARNEWNDPSISEGVVLDYDGYVVEGTMSNIFWVTEGTVYTPQLDRCGVAGVIRDLLVERLSQHGYNVLQGLYAITHLLDADEVFVCNSVIDIWPVRQLADRSFSIGSVSRKARSVIEQEYIV